MCGVVVVFSGVLVVMGVVGMGLVVMCLFWSLGWCWYGVGCFEFV